MLTKVVSRLLDNLPFNISRDCWYQLYGALPHSQGQVNQKLTTMFADRVRGLNKLWKWPPRSPDLIFQDFFLYGHIQNRIYHRPFDSYDELLARHRRSFAKLNLYEIKKPNLKKFTYLIVVSLRNISMDRLSWRIATFYFRLCLFFFEISFQILTHFYFK